MRYHIMFEIVFIRGKPNTMHENGAYDFIKMLVTLNNQIIHDLRGIE